MEKVIIVSWIQSQNFSNQSNRMSLHNNLMRLHEILASQDSIKNYVDEVYGIRMALVDQITEEEESIIINKIRNKVQQEAKTAWINNEGWGAFYMATGSGKSKPAVELACDCMVAKEEITNPLIVVPTEKLRDENWRDEFNKWGFKDSWDHAEGVCYASLNKYENQIFDFVVLDEAHNSTENNVQKFFAQNTVKHCLVLTATEPKDFIKKELFKSLRFKPVYELSLDESVKLGIVAPYDITVVTMMLDNIDKYIVGGPKNNQFKVTEKGQYNYLSSLATARPSKSTFIRRMQFIYNLRSKTEVAKLILKHVIPQDIRTLIFCGSKAQAVEVCENRFFSRPSPPKKLKEDLTITPARKEAMVKKYQEDMIKYEQMKFIYRGDEDFIKFKTGEIDRMACCEALDEGHNLNDVDCGFVVQLNSNPLRLIQRIGRCIRYRPGHRGKIIILCVEDSVDNDWVRSATRGMANIEYVELSRLRLGMEEIIF